ncbi:MAG: hypothetical protein ACOX8V_03240 [Thermoleophilia bacterium]
MNTLGMLYADEILGSAGLLEFPHLEYTERFKRDFAARDKKVKAMVLSALAKVSVLFDGGRVDLLKSDGGLQYGDLKGDSGVGHFRVNLSWRITCKVVGPKLQLRRVGSHDEIQKSP